MPKRANARWLDGDCPREVLAIFDNRGKTFDRYTVMYVPAPGQDWISYLGASAHPFDPRGFGQHGELSEWDARAYRYDAARRGESARWSTLPADVKRAVLQDVATMKGSNDA